MSVNARDRDLAAQFGSDIVNTRMDNKPQSKSALTAIAKAVQTSLIGLLAAHGASHAATIEVNSHLDDGTDCTLRDALVSMTSQSLQNGCVNASADAFNVNDTILFAPGLSGNTITLAGSELSLGFFSYGPIMREVEINASAINRITVDANQQSGVFRIGQSIVSIDNVTITGGSASTYGGGIFVSASSVNLNNGSVVGNYAANGGGGIGSSVTSSLSITNSQISNNSSGASGGGMDSGTSTIINSTISNNTAINDGGGIVGRGPTNLTDSTVSSNSAVNGGGLFLHSASSSNIRNSTISGNVASNNAGGIEILSSTLSLNNSTLYKNTAGNVHGAGALFAFFNSSASLSNSILAGSPNDDCTTNSSSYVTSDSATIVSTDGCSTSARNINPQLGSLSDNGGDTKTHALRAVSPARNTGDILTCEVEDQRGELRDKGDGLCDVGAIEFNPNDASSFFVIPLSNGKAVVIPE